METIVLSTNDLSEGLRLERDLARAHDLIHVAENDLNRYIAHLRTLYNVPDGWSMCDWLKGFEPEQHHG